MMIGIISIFSLPQELEDLSLILEKLKRNSIYINNSIEYKVIITMCLSDELTDWENTQLPKEYIRERTSELVEKYLDWCIWELDFDNPKILGCMSHRRFCLKQHQNADFFIWIDNDMIFPDTSLNYITSAYQVAKLNNLENVIITPEIIKYWDNSWDVITNKNYLNKSHDYHNNSNIYYDSLPILEEVKVKIIPTFKFGAGWFTLISKSLLNEIDIPESLGHYGPDDTYIMECSKIMKIKGKQVDQLVLENLICCEIRKNRTNTTIKKYISSKNKKEEFKKISTANFGLEINKFISRIEGNKK